MVTGMLLRGVPSLTYKRNLRMQTKTKSLLEAATNTFVGYAISVAIGQFIYPIFGYAITITDNMGLTAVFVSVSLVRSYVVRRWFTKRSKK